MPPKASTAGRIRRRLHNEVRGVGLRVGELVERAAGTEFAKIDEIARPHTMCGFGRRRGLYQAVRRVTQNDIPGAIVECGTARGGSALLMALAARSFGSPRAVWAFDTFEGLPPPSENDPDYAEALPFTGKCRGDIEDVRSLFEQHGAAEEIHLVKGLFEETLPEAEVGPIAVLHVDCDWYDSVWTTLTHLFDHVSPGGVIQIDDFGHWAGAQKAVLDFLESRYRRMPRLIYLDAAGRQLIKPSVA